MRRTPRILRSFEGERRTRKLRLACSSRVHSEWEIIDRPSLEMLSLVFEERLCVPSGPGKKECGRYDSAACELSLMLSRGTVELVDRDAPQDSFAQAFSAR